MSDIKLDSTTFDIYVSEGDLSLTTTTDSIDQFLRQKLKTFFGEWFLDNRIGLPYFQQIFAKNFDIDIIDSAIKREILTTNGIIELLEFDLDLDAGERTLTVTFKARTETEVIRFVEVLP